MDPVKKSILYIGGFELPDKNAAAHRVIANGKMFAELNYEVFYLGTQKTDKSLKVEDTKYCFDGFTCWSLPYPQNSKEWLKYITSASEVIDIIEHYLPALPEAIVAYDYPAIALARILNYCRKKGILLIGDTTEWYQPDQGSILFRAIKSFDTSFRMRWLYKRLDGMITVSRFLFDYYKKSNANVIMLPPLVDLSDKKWESENEKPTDAIQLVYAGQAFSKGSKRKDRIDKVLLALSEAVQKKPVDFKLTVMGATKDSYLENFGADKMPGNIEDKIFFSGRVSHTEVLKIIKAADFSIFIRDDYKVTRAGFPTKFVESISCGTPVITNLSSNIAEYLIDGKFGFIMDISDHDRLAETLINAISQPKEKIKEMKLACNNSRLFDYHNFLDSLGSFLNKIKADQ